jgi:cathepsin X
MRSLLSLSLMVLAVRACNGLEKVCPVSFVVYCCVFPTKDSLPLLRCTKVMPGHKVQNSYHSPLPYTYITESDLPKAFFWGNVNGTSFLTKSFNQHIPVYCGACWAHTAISILSDRIKIARNNIVGDDIVLSIQFLLNCGSEVAGSCHGGSATGAFEFIKNAGFIPYETCQSYLACSSDSEDDFCRSIDTSCSPLNVCRTCTNPLNGGNCSAVSARLSSSPVSFTF